MAGVGLNVTLTRDELPVPTATSLLLENATCLDRERLLAAILTGLAGRYTAWAAAPDAGRPAGGIPALVRHGRPGGPGGTARRDTAHRPAADVDAAGRLAVRTGSGTTMVGAGDVVHVRPDRRLNSGAHAGAARRAR